MDLTKSKELFQQIIKLELLETVKIYLVVNISRVQKYKDQVEEQKKECSFLVVIKEEEEYEIKKY